MKKIEAIIHHDQLPAVKERLAAAGIDSRLTVSEVSGLDAGPIVCGHLDEAGRRKHVSRTLAARRRLKVEFITGDRQAHRAVDALLQYARSDLAADNNGKRDHGCLTVIEVTENLPLGHYGSEHGY